MENFKLIYHNIESFNGGFSPFDIVIKDIIYQKDIKIVCPFINSDYFIDLVQRTTSWKLVTDVPKWMKSINVEERNKIFEFLLATRSIERIHFFKNIHAKVIIAEDKAYLGSANLTNNGMKELIEMGVLIIDPDKIKELDDWFNNLWENSDSLDENELRKYLESIQNHSPEENEVPNEYQLFCKSPRLNAKLSDNRKKWTEDEIEILRKIKNYFQKVSTDKRWLDDLFDLAKELIEFFGIDNEDPRFAITLTKEGAISLNINGRWVLRPEKNEGVGLIMPLEYTPDNYEKDNYRKAYDYDLDRRKQFFYRRGIQEARWIEYNRSQNLEFFNHIKNYWKQAVEEQLQRGKKSNRRKNHIPLLYDIIMDSSLRREFWIQYDRL